MGYRIKYEYFWTAQPCPTEPDQAHTLLDGFFFRQYECYKLPISTQKEAGFKIIVSNIKKHISYCFQGIRFSERRFLVFFSYTFTYSLGNTCYFKILVPRAKINLVDFFLCFSMWCKITFLVFSTDFKPRHTLKGELARIICLVLAVQAHTSVLHSEKKIVFLYGT